MCHSPIEARDIVDPECLDRLVYDDGFDAGDPV
jgi:hypothetical protein